MNSKKVKVLRDVGMGYLITKMPGKEEFQFCVRKFWKDLGGPDNVSEYDTYIIREAEHGYPSVNWETPEKVLCHILNTGNEGHDSENIVIRDIEAETTLQITAGHVICSEKNHARLNLSDWSYDPDEKTFVYLTPTGYRRAEEDFDRRTSKKSKKKDPHSGDLFGIQEKL